MRSKEQIAVLHDLFNQINGRLDVIGETPDAYFLCQCVEILKQQGVTIDTQDTRITELQAQLADSKQVNQWQPIETAPIGGGAELVTDPKWVVPPKILLLFKNDRVVVCSWDWYYAEGGGGFNNDVSAAWVEELSGEQVALQFGNPIGWMPLPAAPAIAEGKA